MINGSLGLPTDLIIPPALQRLILDGLMDNLPPFAATLPIVDLTLGQILNLPDQLRLKLKEPIANYFGIDPTPTVLELVPPGAAETTMR